MLPEPSCPVPYTWAVATKWLRLLEEDMVAGTGDQESPREQRPPPSRPGPRTWTRWPPCSLRALSRTRLRAGSGRWNRCDARLHSSILGAGSTLQSAVHFLSSPRPEAVLLHCGWLKKKKNQRTTTTENLISLSVRDTPHKGGQKERVPHRPSSNWRQQSSGKAPQFSSFSSP